MNFHCIEALLDLPEFRVFNQVIGPKHLDLHLERQELYILCPRCEAACFGVKATRTRCIRDLGSEQHTGSCYFDHEHSSCSDSKLGFLLHP